MKPFIFPHGQQVTIPAINLISVNYALWTFLTFENKKSQQEKEKKKKVTLHDLSCCRRLKFGMRNANDCRACLLITSVFVCVGARHVCTWEDEDHIHTVNIYQAGKQKSQIGRECNDFPHPHSIFWSLFPQISYNSSRELWFCLFHFVWFVCCGGERAARWLSG